MSSGKSRLGKGLDALIPGSRAKLSGQAPVVLSSGLSEINVSDIKPNTLQPRKTFTADKMEELIQSIKENGIIEPIILNETGSGKYEIIAGERRFIAAQRAGLRKVPAVIKNVTAMKKLEWAVVENIIREDLNPIEEAMAYKQLMEGYRMTQEQLAAKLGRVRATVANTLRLLMLPESVQQYVKTGRLNEGHGKVLLGIDDKSRQKALAEQAVKKDLSVRELEELVADMPGKRTRSASKPADNSAEMKDIEKEMKFKLGTKVNIKGSYKRGKIEIEYYNKEDFERILQVFKD
ncbi:MAG: ParB/RepB/Spo0J family partition protein [Candidatus Goldbacteria bacterium]|nr:ParB/RepB/Spo0J family partition protein [Candidatus Goldiibacteriota bacterium]